jgi:hypothetical protein
MQKARQFAWTLHEEPWRFRFLIRDRDSKFTRDFDAVFASERLEIITTQAGAEGKRSHRTLRPHRPRRVPRLAPDREPASPRTRPPRLRRPLQHAQAAPLAASDAACSERRRTPRGRPDLSLSETARPRRRTQPRVPLCRVKRLSPPHRLVGVTVAQPNSVWACLTLPRRDCQQGTDNLPARRRNRIPLARKSRSCRTRARCCPRRSGTGGAPVIPLAEPRGEELNSQSPPR